MQWILGKEKGVLFLPDDWLRTESADWAKDIDSASVLYGGFLCSEILGLSEVLPSLHPRLLLDFESGWSAVTLTVSGQSKPSILGPFAAPTAALVHGRAPKGLYLLSGERLRASFKACQDSRGSAEELALAIHSCQSRFGAFFCDPQLEVSLSALGQHDFQYKPPTLAARVGLAFQYLLGKPS